MYHNHQHLLPCLHCHPHTYIRMVQHLIERCLLLRMTRDQCIKALAEHANIRPLITLTGHLSNSVSKLRLYQRRGKQASICGDCDMLSSPSPRSVERATEREQRLFPCISAFYVFQAFGKWAFLQARKVCKKETLEVKSTTDWTTLVFVEWNTLNEPIRVLAIVGLPFLNLLRRV